MPPSFFRILSVAIVVFNAHNAAAYLSSVRTSQAFSRECIMQRVIPVMSTVDRRMKSPSALFSCSSASNPTSGTRFSLHERDGYHKFLSSAKKTASQSALFNAAAAVAAVPSDGNVGGGPETKKFNPGPSITFGSSGLKLNLFGTFYGFVAISLGIFWWTALTIYQMIKKIFPKLDPFTRIPIGISHTWGMALMKLTRCYPIIKGRENLETLYGKNPRPAMFVANHSSWMDIPFLSAAIGWNNYKIISKMELLKVPILSKSLTVGGHVMLDRTSRRSQLTTYKKGIEWLKNGVHLCTFAEGTRSRDGRLQPFKNGAFKMAEAVGAPIVPVSIRYAHLVNPVEWVFPFRSARSVPSEIILGTPIETVGKDDAEVLAEVREAMIAALPECQHPLPDTPDSAS
eukprot:CAMPEP_0195525346 /NCGR_PEP_ID=MMETSP0794_2-20130614/25761_1 /TAXON_ID=515487 /ORGANISM="Stephanopyxis turris, Strain CCMP 815" /LENGTH=399 /DNA_ID=CAMNT_0040655797 /DNA_START=9 /DNA_END=1208 /DNA_ORIENTATION=-